MTHRDVIEKFLLEIIGDPQHIHDFLTVFEAKFPFQHPLNKALDVPQAKILLDTMLRDKEAMSGFIMSAYRKYLAERGLTH